MSATLKAVRLKDMAKFSVTTSLLAIGVAFAAPAYAQDDEEAAVADAGSPAIIVTGTRIKGVDPVGSAVIPVDRAAIENLGVSSTNDALRKLPQVVNFGGSDDQAGGSVVQNSSLNTFFAKSINLRGLGTASTLSLVNGHRVAPQGPNGQLFDADNIPPIAIERIEVVADGGSAIYGSDAIGGVVNFITRRPQNTLEAQFRVGLADSVEEYMGAVAAGRDWGTGGIFLAYQYQKRTALEAGDRPDLYNSDLSPYGGAANPATASPGNVGSLINVDPSKRGPYGIPAGQDGTGITLNDLLPGVNRQNVWEGADAVPGYERHSVTGTFEQEFGDSVTFKADGFFSRRSYEINGIAQAGTLTVGNTNPYSPCYVGKVDDSASLNCPANADSVFYPSGFVTVPYSYLNDLGPTTTVGYEQIWSIAGGFDVALGDRWDANISGYYSEDEGNSFADNQVNGSGLARVLNGVGKPADVPFFNPFCDGRAFNCNSEATLAHFRASTEIGSKFATYGGTANVSGELFTIGGGDVRVAVGGEFHHDKLSGTGQISNTRTPNVETFTSSPVSNQRDVASVYGEAFIPLFGPDNAVPGIERLEFNAAVRYDHYSDVGSTTNPKFGINYSPARGVTFRGSYGTSFRAPTLVDVNKYATAGFLIRTGASGTAVGLLPADGLFDYAYPIGGNPDLKPEQATTWSIGVDIDEDLIPGLRASLTYYNIKYTDKVDTAAYNVPIGAALNSGLYDDFIVFNPLFFPGKTTMTIDQYVAYWNTITEDDLLPILAPFTPDPRNIIAIVDARRNNTGIVKTDGLDFTIDYRAETSFGAVTMGAQANYIFHYWSSPVPTAPLTNEVNNFGYPARLTGKLNLGVEAGGFSANAYLNHVNARNIPRAFMPAAIPDQYLTIGSFTTVDLTLRYAFEESDGLLGGLAFSVSALNLLDTDPPLMVNTGGSPIRFDPSYASPVGRFVSFGVTKKF